MYICYAALTAFFFLAGCVWEFAKNVCFSQSLTVDIHVPTPHLLFHPQSPVLTDRERLSPTLPPSTHSSKVTPINSTCLMLHHSEEFHLD